jgi:histidyl-tRNA synthetase
VVVIVGERERAEQEVQLRQMHTRQESRVPRADLADVVGAMLQ